MKKIALIFFSFLLYLNVNAQGYIIGGDSSDFESNTSFINSDTAIGNVWQIGLPQKTFFGTAYSGPFAIMTDTINSYPTNNLSSFDISLYDTASWGLIPHIQLGFWHKYETDSLKDGGYIEMSIDSGVTWQNIATQTFTWGWAYFPTNFYSPLDTIFGNIPAFTGGQNNWEYSEYSLQFVFPVLKPAINDIKSFQLTGDVFTQKIMFRFNFKSDGIETNKAGWIIDNLVIRELSVVGGVHENESTNFDVKVYPNPIHEIGIIQVLPKKNEHDFTINIYNSLGQIVLTSKMDKNNQFIINKNDLDSGIYLFSVISKDGTSKNGKLLIK